MTVAHEAICAQVNAAHAQPIRVTVLPLDEQRFRRVAGGATRFVQAGG